MGRPSIFPTGVTIFNKEKTYCGYTLFATEHGTTLIDMNGTEVRIWKGLDGFPPKLLPGGNVIGSTGTREFKFSFQDNLDLVQVDWDGNITWMFDKNEYIEDPGRTPRYMARQHHDFQREGSPVGYFAPGSTPLLKGSTLILTHTNVRVPAISDKLLLDDRIIEVNTEGEIVWDWKASDHFDELGFTGDALNSIYKNPNMMVIAEGENVGDWVHINSVSYLGSNRHYDAGDERFNPDNIVMDAREVNIMFIVDKKSGSIVWKLGPDFENDAAARKLGGIIGQHHFHMIPKGLPGEGNMLVFDNGGFAGYGSCKPGAPEGRHTARRHYSRVLEFDPVTLELAWSYSLAGPGGIGEAMGHPFFSPLVSSAQRLPNGNTFITEGCDGRLFEVTKENEIVWEYINPYKSNLPGPPAVPGNVYRAYRYPYDWVPQHTHAPEVGIEPLERGSFRVPDSAYENRIAEAAVSLIQNTGNGTNLQ